MHFLLMLSMEWLPGGPKKTPKNYNSWKNLLEYRKYLYLPSALYNPPLTVYLEEVRKGPGCLEF